MGHNCNRFGCRKLQLAGKPFNVELKGLLPLSYWMHSVPDLSEDAIMGYKKHQLMFFYETSLALPSGAVMLMCKHYAVSK